MTSFQKNHFSKIETQIDHTEALKECLENSAKPKNDDPDKKEDQQKVIQDDTNIKNKDDKPFTETELFKKLYYELGVGGI